MQRDRWEKEYGDRKDLPSSRTNKPSRALVSFLENHSLSSGPVLDIGSGLGRNSVYLAQQGRKVIGIEIARNALETAKTNAKTAGFEEDIEFLELSAGQKDWPFDDNQFALALDMMVLHVLNKKERENYAKNLIRVLKPGGYFVFYTIAADSPATQDLFRDHPGKEPNSYVIPQSGMVEKAFTEEELKEMFAPLEVIFLEKKTEFTHAFGDVFEVVYYSGVMRKN